MRKISAALFVTAALATTAAPVVANPSPPTNGGNGGGKSGQCTGSAQDRPTSCQSPGGVSQK